MEQLKDANCRNCSIRATLKHLHKEMTALSVKAKVAQNRIEQRNILDRIVTLDKQCRHLDDRIRNGRISEDYDDDVLIKSIASSGSTKQVMIAKPPKILALHISRSAFHEFGGLQKNMCQIVFPEILDISAYCTTGELNVHPDQPISQLPQEKSPSTRKPYLYRLKSTIVHYGSHSYGHFVAYRRLPCHCKCQQCDSCDHIWLRVSDEKVDRVNLRDVLHANPYMLMYEAIESDHGGGDLTDNSAQHLQSANSTSENPVAAAPIMFHYSYISETPESIEAIRIANSLLNGDDSSSSSSEIPRRRKSHHRSNSSHVDNLVNSAVAVQ
ncbi:unnamed protein product [Umbelopsis vinacea]